MRAQRERAKSDMSSHTAHTAQAPSIVPPPATIVEGDSEGVRSPLSPSDPDGAVSVAATAGTTHPHGLTVSVSETNMEAPGSLSPTPNPTPTATTTSTSEVPWIWRWGALPKKSKSSTNLQASATTANPATTGSTGVPPLSPTRSKVSPSTSTFFGGTIGSPERAESKDDITPLSPRLVPIVATTSTTRTPVAEVRETPDDVHVSLSPNGTVMTSLVHRMDALSVVGVESTTVVGVATVRGESGTSLFSLSYDGERDGERVNTLSPAPGKNETITLSSPRQPLSHTSTTTTSVVHVVGSERERESEYREVEDERLRRIAIEKARELQREKDSLPLFAISRCAKLLTQSLSSSSTLSPSSTVSPSLATTRELLDALYAHRLSASDTELLAGREGEENEEDLVIVVQDFLLSLGVAMSLSLSPSDNSERESERETLTESDVRAAVQSYCHSKGVRESVLPWWIGRRVSTWSTSVPVVEGETVEGESGRERESESMPIGIPFDCETIDSDGPTGLPLSRESSTPSLTALPLPLSTLPLSTHSLSLSLNVSGTSYVSASSVSESFSSTPFHAVDFETWKNSALGWRESFADLMQTYRLRRQHSLSSHSLLSLTTPVITTTTNNNPIGVVSTGSGSSERVSESVPAANTSVNRTSIPDSADKKSVTSEWTNEHDIELDAQGGRDSAVGLDISAHGSIGSTSQQHWDALTSALTPDKGGGIPGTPTTPSVCSEAAVTAYGEVLGGGTGGRLDRIAESEEEEREGGVGGGIGGEREENPLLQHVIDDDTVSLHEVALEDISPEPAGGDFYDSDTDSYRSLSLDEGEIGRVRGRGDDSEEEGGGEGERGRDGMTKGNGGRRRFRRYRYRKSLIPSREQIDRLVLRLKEGNNDLIFSLETTSSLLSPSLATHTSLSPNPTAASTISTSGNTSGNAASSSNTTTTTNTSATTSVPIVSAQLYVWPSDCKIVVIDLESFIYKKMKMNSTSWFISPTVKEIVDDEVVELLINIHEFGYKLLYFTSSSSTTSSTSNRANSLSSSKDILSKIVTSKGLSLPYGPILKSPEALLRAFGASRTEVFKAAALRGLRGLFPSDHNPFHAGFLSRSSDVVAFERNNFPSGRIFVLNEQVIPPNPANNKQTGPQPQTMKNLKWIHRQGTMSFSELRSMINEIFPDLRGKYDGNYLFMFV